MLFRDLLDLTRLLPVLEGILAKFRSLVREDLPTAPILGKARIETCWRRTPFMDTRAYIDFATLRGVPLVQYDLWVPEILAA
jgi:hypothetical protein